MDKKEVEEVIKNINGYLKEQLWMDFEIIEYSRNQLKIIGSIDTSVCADIEIIFNDIFFISSPLEWKTDTKIPPLMLVDGEEAMKINLQFHVEKGYYLFNFSIEDYSNQFGCIIGAKRISFKIAHEL